jgi:hypothetical protein
VTLEDVLHEILDGLHAKEPLGFAIVPERGVVVISTKEALAKIKTAYWPSSMPADGTSIAATQGADKNPA